MDGTTLSRLLDPQLVHLPAEAWWLPGILLLILGSGAAYDAVRGRVPDGIILAGSVVALGTLGLYADWPEASHHLLWGLGASLLIWGVNQLYYRFLKHDAIGMGDAKWTLLAVIGFGWMPAAFAWIVGAWLGALWLTGAWLFAKARGRKNFRARVHFTPFLFLGLLAGLYILTVR